MMILLWPGGGSGVEVELEVEAGVDHKWGWQFFDRTNNVTVSSLN